MPDDSTPPDSASPPDPTTSATSTIPTTLTTSTTPVAVLGAGTMGHGIATAFAAGGRPVALFDVDSDQLDAARDRIAGALGTLAAHGGLAEPDAAADRIRYTADLADAVAAADLVIEAVPEDLDLKRETFERVAAHAPDDAVLATNTSSLSVTDIAAAVDEPGRVVGTHWFNPPHVVPVVEVVSGDDTADATADAAADALAAVGKTPVRVRKDVPGFIANRIQAAMANEAWALLRDGVASAADIDAAVRGSFGFRLPVLGVFEKSDHSGLDVHHAVLDRLLAEVDRGTEPIDALTDLVEAGNLGTKTGRGVYDWTDHDLSAVEAERDRLLLDVLSVYRDGQEHAVRPTEGPGTRTGSD